MKKFIFIIAITVFCLPVFSQEHWKNGFTVEVEFNNTGGHKENKPAFRKFRGTTISGGYKAYLFKGLFLKPVISVYYEDHNYINPPIECSPNPDWTGGNDEPIWVGGCKVDGDGHSTEFGMGIGLHAGYSIPVGKLVSIEPLTGISYSYAFDQHEKDGYSGHEWHTMFPYNRSSLRWRFGANINVWRMKIGAAYDISLLKINGGSTLREKNVFSASIGYNF